MLNKKNKIRKKVVKNIFTVGLVLTWLLTGFPNIPYLFTPLEIKEVHAGSQTYTAGQSGTFNTPAGATNLVIELWGGGGGSAGTNNAGGNGGTPNVYSAGTGGSELGGNGAGGFIRLTWTDAVIDISGVIYQSSNESLPFDCSSGGPYTVRLRVDNSGSYSADCDQNTGAWSVSNVSANSGQTIYAYIYGEGINGSTVLISNGSTQSDVLIYVNRVALRDDANASITNSEILVGNTSDTDDLITTTGTDVVVASTYETHIYTGDTYVPGANVSTGSLHVVGNYTAGTYTLTLTATSGTLLTRTGTFTQDTSTVSVTSANFLIGDHNSDTSWDFNGQIDEVKIFNYALTFQQIKDLYNEGAVRFGP